MTKRIVISLIIELFANQSIIKFKHKCLWQHAIQWKSLENSTWVQEHCWFIVKGGITGVGNVGIILLNQGFRNAFTSCCLSILFICPSCLKEKYFSKINCGKIFVCKHLLDKKMSSSTGKQ